MAYLIVKGGKANSLTYTLTQLQTFHIESLVATVDATAAVQDSWCEVVMRDQGGFLIARSRSSATLALGAVSTMTFAPELPDSEVLNNFLGSTVITSGLADTIMPSGGTVTVTLKDAAALVSGFNMWVEDAGEAGTTLEDELEAFGRWLFVPGPGG